VEKPKRRPIFLRFRQGFPSQRALAFVVARDRPHQGIGIRDDFHRSPAQPRAVIYFICSRVGTGPSSSRGKLKISQIRPFARAAFNSIK
jgi:hypothetical protein